MINRLILDWLDGRICGSFGLHPPEHIFGTRLKYDASGEIVGISQVSAGYGKVAVLNQLQTTLQISDERVIYSGDGSSDVHVMLHINQRKGYTIAVSQADFLTQIAKRTVLSDDALSVLVPILEDICDWDAPRIRGFFESHDLLIQEWANRRRADAGAVGNLARGARDGPNVFQARTQDCRQGAYRADSTADARFTRASSHSYGHGRPGEFVRRDGSPVERVGV